MNTWQNSQRTDGRFEAGFTLIELAIVVVAAGLILVPLVRIAGSWMITARSQQSQIALETAAEALISYAASNSGCLPFAADSEGGLPDTNQAGNPLTDTGIGVDNVHSGDLPWSELDLTNEFRDGDQLRIQYYVGTPYTDEDKDRANGISCRAGFRGFQWNPQINYAGVAKQGPVAAKPVYVYYTPSGGQPTLYKIEDANDTPNPYVGLAPGTPPVADTSVAEDVTAALPDPLLEVKRGPDIAGAGAESDTMSEPNVFVLIAVGTNRNADLNRRYMRDAGHAGNVAGGNWPLGRKKVDGSIFSLTHGISTTDRLDDGDDTLLVMSFVQYRSRLREFGLNMEPVMCKANEC